MSECEAGKGIRNSQPKDKGRKTLAEMESREEEAYAYIVRRCCRGSKKRLSSKGAMVQLRCWAATPSAIPPTRDR